MVLSADFTSIGTTVPLRQRERFSTECLINICVFRPNKCIFIALLNRTSAVYPKTLQKVSLKVNPLHFPAFASINSPYVEL